MANLLMSSYRLNCSLGSLDSNGQSDKSKQNYFIIEAMKSFVTKGISHVGLSCCCTQCFKSGSYACGLSMQVKLGVRYRIYECRCVASANIEAVNNISEVIIISQL